MNWKRIWTGSLLAGTVFFLLDWAINSAWLGPTWKELQQSGYIYGMEAHALPIYIAMDFGIGFILTWLYALARPRLGPGPKTALIMGTLAWFLIYIPMSGNYWIWFKLPSIIPLTLVVGGLLQCWIAIYLAGWQYIEKAP